jgi:hypothetical protein
MKIQKYSEFNQINEEEEGWFGDAIAKGWQKVKYGLSKLGRYKADGKIFGKGETDKKWAEEMGRIMGDTANAVIKGPYDELKAKYPEWPNTESRYAFLKGIIMYGQLYDSIKAATEKKPGEEGYLDPLMANKLIKNLQRVVKKALDVDLAAVYSVMDNNQNIDLEEEESLFEELDRIDDDLLLVELARMENGQINEEFLTKLRKWGSDAMDKLFGKEDEDSLPRKAGSRQSAKLQGAGDDETVDSERMNTLDSNKLPLILAGVGAALGVLGWIGQTEWFKELVTKTITQPDQWGEKTFTDTIEKKLVVDERGWSYTIQNNGFMDATGKSLNFDQPASNLRDAFKFYGGGDELKGVEAMKPFLGPDFQNASSANVLSQLSNPANQTVGDIFNKVEGTWGDNFFMNQDGGVKSTIAKQIFTRTKRVLLKKGFTLTTTTAIGGKLIAIAPWLSAIGVTLVGAGAVLKLLREKGKRLSRAKTLNLLLQSLKEVPVNQQQGGESQSEDDTTSGETTKVDEKSIYPLMIKNLKALQSMLVSFDGVGLEGEAGTDTGKGKIANPKKDKLEVGKVYTFTNKQGKKSKVKLISLTHDTGIGPDNQWITKDDIKRDTLANDKVSVIFQDDKGKFTKSSPEMAVNVAQLAESKIDTFGIFEKEFSKEFTKQPRAVTITKEEEHLTQAFKNVSKVLNELKDTKAKGIGVTFDFIQDILVDPELPSGTPGAFAARHKDAKEPIKALYAEVYEFLYGKYSKTMSDFGPLYKENLKVIQDKNTRLVVAEKVARLSKRTLQFEGENMYASLGEFGADMRDFNTTLKQIMDYFKANENIVLRFDGFKINE